MLVLVLVLVLVLEHAIEDRSMFDHEKLDPYRLSIAFVAWAGAILDEKPRRGR